MLGCQGARPWWNFSPGERWDRGFSLIARPREEGRRGGVGVWGRSARREIGRVVAAARAPDRSRAWVVLLFWRKTRLVSRWASRD